MRKARLRKILLVSVVVVLMGTTGAGRCQAACPRGDVVNPGVDFWTCPDASYVFGGAGCLFPIPADFFAPGSDPFQGTVNAAGHDPLVDTIIERLDQAVVPEPHPKSDPIQIEIIELHLQSVAPITVTYNGGQDPEDWDVEVELSPTPPSTGTMTITKTHCNGGTYTADLPVQPQFTFTKVGDPGEVRVLDTGSAGWPPINLNGLGPCPWEHTPDGNDFRPSKLCPYTMADAACSMTLVPSDLTEDCFSVQVDEQGVAQGGGSGYNNGQWYYYTNTDWSNQWFYDDPFDLARMKIIDVFLEIQPLDPCQPSQVTIAYNWSTPLWLDPNEPPLPPLTPVEESLYIERSIFFEDDLSVWPQFVEDHFEIWEYNPEWISIDVNGYNYEIIGGCIDHACIPTEVDFGDAPDPNYPTLLANDGARHIIGGPYFCDAGGGDFPDPEPDGQPHASAMGDDTDGNDDEDGVNFPVLLVVGQPGIVALNVCGGGGIVELWIDYNGDEDWDDAGEFEFSAWMGNGPNTISVTPPALPAVGQTFARCRISTTGTGSPTGLAPDGEVEDHMVTIDATCWHATECPCQPQGDCTCDGFVNLADLLCLKAYWALSAPWGGPNCCSDYNQSGSINLSDLLALKAGFGKPCPPGSTGNQKCP
jgi:hypothetical protein